MQIKRITALSISVLTLQLYSASATAAENIPAKPNFIIIFTDDQGYGDLGCFGSTKIKTPHIDRMAKEGCKFTNFLVGSSVCTPSRAALLTGCYPKRVGMHQGVVHADSTIGLHPNELTIADHLKGQGYATACVGKWHLGHHPETLPTRQGFDYYYGIPYSNDMNLNAEALEGGKLLWSEPDSLWKDQASSVTKWNTPLMEGEKIIELPTDQRTVTRRYTDKAIKFIKDTRSTGSGQASKPFFIYLAHSMPHVPLYVPEDVYDPDPKNAYTNVIEHLDAETGRLLDTLRETGLDKNTYVIFTSDNGPWTYLYHHAGSAGPLRGHKGQTFEGGMRVPCIMWGPGIPAGTECDQLTTTLDLLPTIATLAGTELPKNHKIDGLDISHLLTDPTKKTPRDEFLYYSNKGNLDGIRQGSLKLLRRVKQPKKGEPKPEGPPQYNFSLFDLSKDIGETNNLAEEKSDLVTELDQRMKELDAEITKNARAPWEKP